jgi:hypothetical protein
LIERLMADTAAEPGRRCAWSELVARCLYSLADDVLVARSVTVPS